jgi:putative acetyltransferase
MHRMATHVQIRRATPRDFDALGEVFHAAVHEGAGQYSPGQRAAWSPAPRRGESWHAHLGAQLVWLAEADGRPLGFMSLTPEGYLDLAYILAEAQGQGLFRRLYADLEDEARASGLVHLWTDASLHAKAPFEAVGFAVCYAETVSRSGETLKRFRMEKTLNA